MTDTSIGPEPAPSTSASEAAQLAVAVLDAEAERESQQAASAEQVLFATDVLPGVGEEQITLGGALREGGVATFVVLLLLQAFEELEHSTLSVLSPDIRDAFGVGNGAIVFLASASGAFLVLGALWLLAASLNFARDVLAQQLGHCVVADLRHQVMCHVLQLPVAYFDRAHVGEITTRLISDTEQLRRTLAEDFIRAVGDAGLRPALRWLVPRGGHLVHLGRPHQAAARAVVRRDRDADVVLRVRPVGLERFLASPPDRHDHEAGVSPSSCRRVPAHIPIDGCGQPIQSAGRSCAAATNGDDRGQHGHLTPA